MLVAVMYGLSSLPEFVGIVSILIGCSGIVIFIMFESKIDYPVLNINLFRKNRTFAFSNLAALINYSATFAITFLLSLYLQYIKGLNPQNAGLILIAQPIMMSILSPIGIILIFAPR